MAKSRPRPAKRAPPGPASGLWDVRKFGARGDGLALDTAAINSAVAACAAAGGGTVRLSPGTYRSGTVRLLSRVRLLVDRGATLLGSAELGDYEVPHLVYADGCEDVALEGPGRIDGQGHLFWYFRGWDPDFKAERQGWGEIIGYWWECRERLEQLVRFTRCRGVQVRDLRIEDAPFWTLHFLACDRVAVRGLVIDNPLHGGNTDGIDIDACRDVVVSDCVISTGDDAICLKCTGTDGLARASRNIAVTNCALTTTCNAFKIGTESRGDFENVAFSNSAIWSPPGYPGLRALAGIAVEMVDGAHLAGVVCSNITMSNVRCPLFVRLGNLGRGQKVPAPGTLRDVLVENLSARGATLPGIVAGVAGHPVEGVRLSGVRIETEGGGSAEQARRELPERDGNYPECNMFGPLPAHGLWARHARDLRLGDVQFRHGPGEHRPAVVCDDVLAFEASALGLQAVEGDLPLVRLVNSPRAALRGCRAPEGAGTYLGLEGTATRGAALLGCDLGAARQAVARSAGAPEDDPASAGSTGI